MKTTIGKFYYFISLLTNLGLPFILLLIMNSFIIHAIRQRPNLGQSNSDKSQIKHQGRGHNEGQTKPTKMKNSELQILIILLLVTFGFLMLTTPAYAFFLYINVADYEATPKIYAGYRLFHSVVQKLNQTNFGINFFLYIISGEKFRSDLVKLFSRKITKDKRISVSTISSH